MSLCVMEKAGKTPSTAVMCDVATYLAISVSQFARLEYKITENKCGYLLLIQMLFLSNFGASVTLLRRFKMSIKHKVTAPDPISADQQAAARRGSVAERPH